MSAWGKIAVATMYQGFSIDGEITTTRKFVYERTDFLALLKDEGKADVVLISMEAIAHDNADQLELIAKELRDDPVPYDTWCSKGP
jgi:hypothetical protein